jgi:hypothetical protein
VDPDDREALAAVDAEYVHLNPPGGSSWRGLGWRWGKGPALRPRASGGGRRIAPPAAPRARLAVR